MKAETQTDLGAWPILIIVLFLLVFILGISAGMLIGESKGREEERVEMERGGGR